MALGWFLALTLLSSLLLPVTAAKAQTLDQYGGYTSLPVPGGATGSFRVGKIGNRWVFATPNGSAFWMLGVYNVDIDDHVDDLGSTYHARVIAKYGDADLTWGPQQNRRLKAWGFNALGEYANKWTLPWTTIVDPKWPGNVQPVKLPAIPFPLQAASYSQTNVNNYAPGPVKELYWALDSHFTGYRGKFPDIFDPNFDLWVAGRVVSAGYAQAAASPWLVGLSSDDTDYLTGFGPGPDFDTGGHTHAHLGYITLLTPPMQSSNPGLKVTYSDPKVYIKSALRNFLQARYGTVGALNSAWGSTYTTFDSDGGWPSGRGLLDENGKGAWVGTDANALSNANATVRRDLDDFLYEIAKQYFVVYRTRIKQAYPNVLYLGPTTIGGWGAPPRRQILQAAGQYLDVIRTSYNGDQARLDFVAQYAGDKPIMMWLGAIANPDSALFRYSNGGRPNAFLSQTDRGADYQRRLTARLNETAGPTGAHPFIGIQWWEFHDNWAEKANFGLVTLSDNAYDGREAVVAAGTDPWGYRTGGEERDYGNFLGQVVSANAGVAAAIGAGGGGNPPPGSVSISSPTSGSTVQQTVTVSAAAASSAVRVDLALDGSLVGIFGGTAVQYPWDTTASPNGTHRWVAKAYDSSGASVTSSPVDVTVSNAGPSDTTPPVVSITQPTNGGSVVRKSKITIQASASDNVGVTRVEFYVNGSLKCSVTVAPYACQWPVPAASPGAVSVYRLQAKAYDARGNVGSSSIVTVQAQ